MDKIKTELAECLRKYLINKGFINIGIDDDVNIKSDGNSLYELYAVVFRNQIFYLYVWDFDSKIEVNLKTTVKPDEVKYLDLSIEMNYELNDNLDEILESIKSDIDQYFSKFIIIVNYSIETIGVRK